MTEGGRAGSPERVGPTRWVVVGIATIVLLDQLTKTWAVATLSDGPTKVFGDTVNVERERDLALSASARQTVDDIERALRQMSDNTFGLCITCGDRIPLARLEVLPWAVQCVKCKARGERRR